MTYLSFALSLLAFILSTTVAWFTLFRRGGLKMSKPAFVAFCYDIGKGGRAVPKIFIRSLIYSTGKRGHVIESMFLAVHNDQGRAMFNIWGYGVDEKLSRGSGLFVGETGVVANHHFNPTRDGAGFEYTSGNYRIEVFATLHGKKRPVVIQTVNLHINDERLRDDQSWDAAIWFEWQPDTNNYDDHLETRPGLLSERMAEFRLQKG